MLVGSKLVGNPTYLTLFLAKANAVAAKINSSGKGKALAVAADVTDYNDVRQLVQQAAKFGNGKLHVIVNNAGYTWDAVVHKVWTHGRCGLVLTSFANIIYLDDRQTMGRNGCCPRNRSIPDHQGSSAIFPSQGRRATMHHQHQQRKWYSWFSVRISQHSLPRVVAKTLSPFQRTNQLCLCESRPCWNYQDDLQGEPNTVH